MKTSLEDSKVEERDLHPVSASDQLIGSSGSETEGLGAIETYRYCVSECFRVFSLTAPLHTS